MDILSAFFYQLVPREELIRYFKECREEHDKKMREKVVPKVNAWREQVIAMDGQY